MAAVAEKLATTLSPQVIQKYFVVSIVMLVAQFSLSVFCGSKVVEVTSYDPQGAILITKRDQEIFEERDKSKGTKILKGIGSIIVGIVVGIAGNAIFAWIISSTR